MTVAGRPLLTIAIPLHRSRPFVDIISANIDAVGRDDVEILLSDRTAVDDALDVLAARHADDPRVVILREVNGADWVQHYNALLRRGRGTYFGFMPHDDDFPPGWVEALVGSLEADPTLIMAFGHIEPIGVDGRLPPAGSLYTYPKGELCNGTDWTVHDAIGAITRWSPSLGARGIFRRAAVVDRGLLLPTTRDNVDADAVWVFGIALLGKMRYVPDVVSYKRWHTQNVGWTWQGRTAWHELSIARAQVVLGLRYGRPLRAKAVVLRTVARRVKRSYARPVWRRALQRSPLLRLSRRVVRGLRRAMRR